MDVVDKIQDAPNARSIFYGEMPLLALKYCEWEDAADSNVIGELLQSRYDKPVLKLYNALKQEIKNKIRNKNAESAESIMKKLTLLVKMFKLLWLTFMKNLD